MYILISFLSSFSVYAAPEVSKRHQIMAGLLLHLSSFTLWPESNHHTMELCILGKDPFKRYINDMIKHRPKNRSGKLIVITRITNVAGHSVEHCNIIYVSSTQLEGMWRALPKHHNILLVGQSDDFIKQGGMVNFYLLDKKIKLAVNLPAVLNADLKISSELLKHAKIVSGQPFSSKIEGS